MTSFPRSQSGMSLVELMVSLVAGLIVAGAAVAFTISSLRSNSEYIGATRLGQELRNGIDFVSRELRRAGYDDLALQYLSQTAVPTPASPFSTMLVEPDADGDGNDDDGCVVYAYDRQPRPAPATDAPGNIDLANGEVRAIRRIELASGIGVLEFADSSIPSTPDEPECDAAGANYATYPPACNATTGWCAFSDPRVLDVTEFAVEDLSATLGGGVGSEVRVRELAVTLTGALVGIQNSERAVSTRIRVRTDCVRADVDTECVVTPTPNP